MVGIAYIRFISILSEICTCLPDLTISKVIIVIIKSTKLLIHIISGSPFVTSQSIALFARKPAQRYCKVSKPPNFLPFFFTLHYVFYQNALELHDFCSKKGCFSAKVVIFATSNRAKRQIDKRRWIISQYKYQQTKKKLRLWLITKNSAL